MHLHNGLICFLYNYLCLIYLYYVKIIIIILFLIFKSVWLMQRKKLPDTLLKKGLFDDCIKNS